MQPRKVRIWSQADLKEILTPPLAGEIQREGKSQELPETPSPRLWGDGAGRGRALWSKGWKGCVEWLPHAWPGTGTQSSFVFSTFH